jgi:hypothetical protein
MIYATLGLALWAILGTVGLANCHPRPRYQQRWAIITLAPIFGIVALAVLGASR